MTHHMCIGFVPHREDVQYYTPVWADKPRDDEGVEQRENQPQPPPGRGGNRGRDDGGLAFAVRLSWGRAGGGFLCYLPAIRCSITGRSRLAR